MLENLYINGPCNVKAFLSMMMRKAVTAIYFWYGEAQLSV